MLRGISPAVSPELLKVLSEMGHGDEIVLTDAHFPAASVVRAGGEVLRADGLSADELLAGIAPLFELDAYATPVAMMAAVPGDRLDPAVESSYRAALGYDGQIERLERFAFYDRAAKAFALVVTGETRQYGNIILKKGVTSSAKRRKVFVSGCYDMLHSGHVRFFEEAAKLGDLYVGLGNDANIRALKNRPTANGERERLYHVKAIRYVKDAWVNSGMGSLDFVREVESLKPDVFFVNRDGWSEEKERFCRARGIELVVSERIPAEGLPARSTTAIRAEMESGK